MRCSVATIERLRAIGLISTLVLGLLAGPLPAEAHRLVANDEVGGNIVLLPWAE